MKELIAYLRSNVILDFQGDLDLETVRGFLKHDNSGLARKMMAKVVQDGGTDEMILVLADCLVEIVQDALTDEVISEQLRMYAES